MFLFLFPYQFP